MVSAGTAHRANAKRAELRYDGHGRQVRWVFPHPTSTGAVNEADYESYGYDAAGNRTSWRKRDGSVFAFQYDALNRMIVKVVPERAGLSATHTRDVFYGYDIGNRQTFARSAFGFWEVRCTSATRKAIFGLWTTSSRADPAACLGWRSSTEAPRELPASELSTRESDCSADGSSVGTNPTFRTVRASNSRRSR